MKHFVLWPVRTVLSKFSIKMKAIRKRWKWSEKPGILADNFNNQDVLSFISAKINKKVTTLKAKGCKNFHLPKRICDVSRKTIQTEETFNMSSWLPCGCFLRWKALCVRLGGLRLVIHQHVQAAPSQTVRASSDVNRAVPSPWRMKW